MKCPVCHGTTKRKTIFGDYVECGWCNGTGEVTINNENWFCNLNTVEKAEWLADFCKFIIESTETGNDVRWATTRTYWDVWLNGVHIE